MMEVKLLEKNLKKQYLPEKLYKAFCEISNTFGTDMNKLIIRNGDNLEVIEEAGDRVYSFFNDLIVYLRTVDGDEFFKNIKINKEEHLFWEAAEQYWNKSKEPYESTEAIRTLQESEFYAVLEEIFRKYIIFNDDLESCGKLAEKEVTVAVGMLQHSVWDITVNRYGKSDYFRKTHVLYGLKQSQSDHIWQIVMNNKEEMFQRVMIDIMFNLRREVEELEKKISNN